MTRDLETLVAEMADVLHAENAALQAAQLKDAAALLPRKRAAASALQEATQSSLEIRRPPSPALRPEAERLQAALALNDTLLSRALAAQQKLVELLLTRNAPDQTRGLYGQSGGYKSALGGANTFRQWTLTTA